MSERYYVNQRLARGPVILQGSEVHHLSQVCRLRRGEHITLFNGDGCEYPAEITAMGRHQVDLQVLEPRAVSRELAGTLTLACPLPRGDRGQFLIEKLTELGATTYQPLQTQRSQLHPGEQR